MLESDLQFIFLTLTRFLLQCHSIEYVQEGKFFDKSLGVMMSSVGRAGIPCAVALSSLQLSRVGVPAWALCCVSGKFIVTHSVADGRLSYCR